MADYCIRAMRPEDLAAVAQVDLAAFSLASQRSSGHAIAHARHRMGLEYFRRAAPDLCHVAEARDGAILGYAIGHHWGDTTWVGPIGVDPGHMGKGIGTRLLGEFCAQSVDSGATVIGLETSIAYNVRLYEKSGFASRGLSLRVAKDLQAARGGGDAAAGGVGVDATGERPGSGRFTVLPWPRPEALEHSARREDQRRLADLVCPGLDHAAELAAVPAAGMGPAFLAVDHRGSLAGYAAMHLRGYRAACFEDAVPPAEPLVWILVGWPGAMEALLAQCEAAAAAAGAGSIRVPFYGANPHAWAALKALGYRIEGAFVRMMYRGDYPGSASQPWGRVPFDLSTWLG